MEELKLRIESLETKFDANKEILEKIKKRKGLLFLEVFIVPSRSANNWEH